MHESTESSSSSESNFAGLLASLTSEKQKPGWDDDELADDVATLSYENAIRAHARYKPADAVDRALMEAARTHHGPVEHYELAQVEETPVLATSLPAAPKAEARTGQKTWRSMVREKKLKCASVTIRMSETECEQLHQRAAESGLTVSAYLRSCTFEAENLRAMVKDTMAQLKAATQEGKRAAPRRGLRGGWLRRLITPWRTSGEMARA